MSNIDTIFSFLKILRCLGFFPYRWNFEKDLCAKNQTTRFQNCFESNACNFQFIKSRIWLVFSNSILSMVIGFEFFRYYMNIQTQYRETITSKIAIPIFGGVLHVCSILIMVQKSLNFSKTSIIFTRILKLIYINSPMKLSFKFKKLSFITYFLSLLMIVLFNIVVIFKNLVIPDFLTMITYIYYIFSQILIFFVIIEFRVVCFCYLYFIKKFLRNFPTKKLLRSTSKDVSDIENIENKLEIFIFKFRELNQHQKFINFYFGPLISYVLIYHICWLILFPLVLTRSFDDGNSSFSDIAKNVLIFIWPCLDIYVIPSTPYLLMKKVRLLL